ncbi:MAG TPA: hypothetical protein VKU41_06905 [Polyangiaceae bacterium]|nr:hypothetical protein [Polyangiaceae bacterium]
MRFLGATCGVLALAFAGAWGVGCSGADQSPLGGPYGGTANSTPPTQGEAITPVNVNAEPGQGTGPAASGASSGAPASSGKSPPSSGSPGPSSGSGGPTTGSSQGSSTGSSGASAGSSGGTPPGSGSSSGSTGGSSGVHAGSSSGSSTSSGAMSGASSGSSMGGSSCDTWTCIHMTYLAQGTPGNCGTAFCHSQMSSPSGAYTWLKGQGYIGGSPPALVGSRSCLTWFGGNMPPGGSRSNSQAVSDLNAWAAAGAQNN